MNSDSNSLRSGQSLLVIVMLIAVVFTLIAAASFRLTTETQVSKSQEENIRVLAAADSGIERGLQVMAQQPNVSGRQTFQQLALTLTGIDAARSNINIAASGGRAFESPVITQNEQFVLYLREYDQVSSSFVGPEYQGAPSIFFGQGGATRCPPTRNKPAMEITLIYGGGNRIQRWVVEDCSGTPSIAGANRQNPTEGSFLVQNRTYNLRYTMPIIGNATFPQPRMLILRPLFFDTSVGVTVPAGSTELPVQGTTIRSEAFATSGVSKVVTLFEPNPQIPSAFFITTF